MYSFEVKDMTCGHCVQRVTAALNAVDPDAFVEIDLPSHTVEVESKKPRATLASALVEAGYPPSPKAEAR